MRHGGNVLAPDPELAMHYARELFGRRNESSRLWVVRRTDIAVLEDPDLLDPPLDRSFKKPGGYVMRDKLAAARERAARPSPPRAPRAMTGRRPSQGRVVTALQAPIQVQARIALDELRCPWRTTSSSPGSWIPSGRASRRCSRRRRDQLHLAGRARARPGVYQLLAEVRDDGRDEDSIAYDREPDEYSTRACSTTRAATGRTRSRGGSFTSSLTRRGSPRSVRATGRSPTSSRSSGGKSGTTGCMSSRGSSGWRTAARTPVAASNPPSPRRASTRRRSSRRSQAKPSFSKQGS